MLAGTIEIEMLANMARLTQDLSALKGHVSSTMESIEKSVEGAKRMLEGLGVALTLREMSRFVLDAVEAADQLGKLAQRTGIAVEALSQLQYVAKQSSVSNDALTMGMKKLNVSMSEGMGGVTAKVEAFANLGISLKDAAGRAKTADQVLLEVADRFAATRDGATKTAYAVALFGKAGDEMIPMLNKGSAGIKEMMGQADKLGLTISGDFAAKAEEFETNLTILNSSSRKLAITLGSALVEGLGEVAKKMAEATVAGGKMHGVMVGLDALGDQMFDWTKHQEEKPLKWLQDDLEGLRLQAAGIKIDLFGQKGALEAEISQKERELADMQAKFYRLTNVQGGRGSVNPAAVVPDKTDLKALSNGNTSELDEYMKLVKTIQERINAGKQEIELGRQLTDAEKFEIKVLTDVKEAKVKLSAAHVEAIKNYLAEAKAVANVNAERAAELHNNANYAKEWAKDEADIAAADKARADERDRVNKTIFEQGLALADSNQQIELEASLLGATDQVRQLALANLQIEIDKKHQIERINQDLLLGEKERLAAIAGVEASAAIAHAQASSKSALEEQLKLVNDIESAGKSMWDAFFQAGSDRVKALTDIIKHYLLDLLYQLAAKPIVLNIAASIFGSGGAGSALTGSGGIGGLLGTANTANSAYSLYNSGVSGMANSGGVLGAFAQGYSGSAAIGTGSSFASTVGGGLATDAMGAGVAEGAAAAGIETGVGAGVTAGLAAIPVVGWVALAGMALYSIFGGQGGGPKSEAGFAPHGMNIAGLDIGGNMQGSQRGDVGAAQQISTGISASYQAIADQLGLVKDKIDVGLFYAQDPEGTSQTQLQVVGGSYNRSTQEGGIENVGRGDQALKDAIALATSQLILSNLQSSELKGKVGDYIKAINPAGMTSDQINASLTLAANARALYAAFEKLGPAFAYVNDMSVQAVNDLVTAAGGMDKLNASLTSYYDNFITEEEKRAGIAKQISDTLAQAGVNISADAVLAAASSADARSKFRQFAEQLAAMGPDGQAAYLAVLSVNGAFANLISTASSAASTIDAIATANTNAQVTSDVAAAQEALNAARKAETTSVQATVTSLASATANFRTFAGNLRDFRDSLLLGNLSPLTPGQKYAEARSQFESAYAAAQGGDPAAMAKLQDVSTAFLQASQVYNASSTAYQSDFAEVQSALTLSASKADAMATQNEAQLAILNAQLSSLETVNSSVLSVKDAIAALAVAVGAAIKAGVNPGATAVSSLTGGVTGKWVDTQVGQVWASAGGAATTGGKIYAINGQSYSIAEATNYINTLVTAGRLTDAYYAFKSAGVTLADADLLMHWAPMTAENWAKSQGLPVFHDGTDYVPHTGLALLQEGEAVISRSRNFGGAGDSGDMLARLIDRVDYLAQCQQEGTRALIGANYDATDKAASKVVEGTAGKQGRASWERRLQAEAAPA